MWVSACCGGFVGWVVLVNCTGNNVSTWVRRLEGSGASSLSHGGSPCITVLVACTDERRRALTYGRGAPAAPAAAAAEAAVGEMLPGGRGEVLGDTRMSVTAGTCASWVSSPVVGSLLVRINGALFLLENGKQVCELVRPLSPATARLWFKIAAPALDGALLAVTMVVFGELEFDLWPEDSLITLLLKPPVGGALAFMDSRNSTNSSLPLVSVRWVLLRETEAVELEAFDRPDKSSFL